MTFYGVDTGIRSTHVEFTGRMLPGVDFIGDGNGTEDCDGHGTHTASAAAGTTYGVAKEMSLVPVEGTELFRQRILRAGHRRGGLGGCQREPSRGGEYVAERRR